LASDRRSAFGGIVAFNRPVDATVAKNLSQVFLEVVVAPSFDGAALEIFKAKQKLRVLQPGPGPSELALDIRPITGGFLVQTTDHTGDTRGDARVVTWTTPDDATGKDLQFGGTVAKHVRSNVIVLAHQGVTVGVGAGQ